MNRVFFLLILSLFISSTSMANMAKVRPFKNVRRLKNAPPLIVKFKKKIDSSSFTRFTQAHRLRPLDELIPSMNIYLMQSHVSPLQEALRALRADPRVEWAQLDHPVKLRSLPNDPDFSKLWGLYNPVEKVDIGAEKTWSRFGTGGRNVLGHEIVLGLNDNGLDIQHRDLKNNVWTNPEEIPGNKIDDDQNGLVDDVHGWDFQTDSPEIPLGDHGTHVAGTMGAEGGNGLQVAGINWNIKIIPVTTNAEKTSQVLKSYGYFLYMKKLWLQSGTHRGANIVAVNSSWGIDYAHCESGEYPAWNDVYNEMGKYGILAVAATINNHTDVDREGDVPTSCSSPFIIGVTNITRQGVKNGRAGYGALNIDLGAPGTEIFSTIPNNQIASYTGTSMAAPHVTGAIGLLYSIASRDFAEYAIAQPANAALQLKKVLLSTVTPQADLQGKTVSGGRMNLFRAAEQISQFLTPE